MVYRSSRKYRETVQVSRVSTIPYGSYQWVTSRLQACDAKTNVIKSLTVKHCASSSHSVTNYYYTNMQMIQLLLSMRASTMQTDLLKLEKCTRDVKSWFAENDLLLNADKSEVMVIGTPSQLCLAESIGTMTVADTCLTVSSQLKSLGVNFAPRLTFERHVSSVCKACNYHIWAVRHTRRVLPQDVTIRFQYRQFQA